MPTYILLSNWTQEGIQKVKESPKRLDRIKSALRKAGGKMKAFYMVMGRYDLVAVVEAPDDETVARLALTIGASGAARTETLKAFTEDEYRKIINALP
jgi:uncharacterized protein with GYD domain